MKKILTIIIILLVLGFTNDNAFAQVKAKTEEKEFEKFSDRIFFGGSIGLLFGTVTRVDILPQVGIWVLPQWAVGIGGRYTFRKGTYGIVGNETKPIKSHIWGISGFTQIIPIRDLDKSFGIGIHGGPIFQVEWEALYLDKSIGEFGATGNSGRGWVQLVLAGAGYHFPLGKRAGLNVLAMWNLSESKYSPYSSNPMLRVSINF